MKRIIVLLITMALVFSVMATGAFAAEQESTLEGVCGDALTYALTQNEDATYTLTITGTGSMADFAAAPWSDYSDQISEIVLEEGVTSISSEAFSGCANLQRVDMAMSVESIGDAAFPADASFEMLGWLNHPGGRYAENCSNVTLKLKQLRVLTIGNSHTEDYTRFFGTMIGDLSAVMDTQIIHRLVWHGGRQLILNELYTSTHYLASEDPSIDGHSDYVDAFAQTWDLVLVQDYRESVKYGAEYADDLQEAMRWIRRKAPGAHIGWVADWAETLFGYTYEPGAEAMRAVQQLSADKPDFIIPMGIMVENARSSYMGKTLNPRGVFGGSPYVHWFPILERDDKHVSLELGRYLIGVGVFYHMVEYLDDMLILDEDFDFFESLTTDPVDDAWAGEFVDDYRPVIEECVLNSYTAPLNVTQSTYTQDPLDAKYQKVTEILEEELPWSVIQERMSGVVVTDDIIAKLNDATGLNLQAEDFTFTYDGITYTINVDSQYGYSVFSKDVLTGGVTGIVDGYYYVNGVKTYAGLIEIDGDYYYINSSCKPVTGSYTVWKTNGLMSEGVYEFAADGKMIDPPMVETAKNGIVTEDGVMYYYVDGVKTYAGLIEIDGDYYYVNSSCKVVTGSYSIWKTNGLMEAGTYVFGADGKMIRNEDLKNGIVTEDGVMYYYVNGVKTYAGLIEIDGDYYYVNSSCKVVTGSYSIWKTNGLMEAGTYVFGADGRMIKDEDLKNGIVTEDGVMYYYVDGVKTYAGLIQIDGDYYYVNSSCKVVTGTYTIWTTNGLLPQGTYEFAEDGKMIRDAELKNGIVTEDGVMYYYVDGVKTYAGLIQIDGDYYYVNSSCKVVTGTYTIWTTNGLLPQGTYEFAADGKMIDPPAVDTAKNGIVTEDGVMYYYVDGIKTYAGLIEIDGDYYYVNSSCKVVTGSYSIWKTNDLLPQGTYEFAADGRMITQ